MTDLKAERDGLRQRVTELEAVIRVLNLNMMSVQKFTGQVKDECEEQRQRLADFEDDFCRVLADQCAPDEMHCSCVPHLRRALAEAVPAFVARVNARAEADMLAGRPITGAHHRALVAELALLAPPAAETEGDTT